MSRDVRLFLQYIAPSMIGMLIAGSFSIVDTIFIGRGIGKTGLAAVALTWPLVMLFGALGDMIGSGAAVIISQSRGAGDEARAQKALGNMVSLQLLGSIAGGLPALLWLEPLLRLFGATPELMPDAFAYARIMIVGAFAGMFMTGCIAVVRNDGRPFLAMWLVICGLLGNMLLDWLFIMVFQWGAAGAAYATVVSQALAGILGLVYFLSPQTMLKITGGSLKLSGRAVRHICITGIPIFGNMLSIIAMLFMHNCQALRYGAVDGLAAYTLVAGLESVGSLLMSGLAGGVQPLTAYLYGAGKHRRQNRIGNYGYWTAFGLGIVLMLGAFAFRRIMPGWVGLTGQVGALAAHGVLLSSPAFLLLGVIRVAGFYYQSTGKIADASLLIYGDSFFALPLCLFLLPVWFGMDGVWLAMPVSRVILFAILCYLWFGKRRKEKAHVDRPYFAERVDGTVAADR